MNANLMPNLLKSALLLSFVLLATSSLVQNKDKHLLQETGAQLVSKSIDQASWISSAPQVLQNSAKKIQSSAKKIKSI